MFSTNAQKFRLDEQVTQRFEVRDVSAATLPKDFERNPRIHKCYEVRVRRLALHQRLQPREYLVPVLRDRGPR